MAKGNKVISFTEWLQEQDNIWLRTINWNPRIIISNYSKEVEKEIPKKDVASMEESINELKGS